MVDEDDDEDEGESVVIWVLSLIEYEYLICEFLLNVGKIKKGKNFIVCVF